MILAILFFYDSKLQGKNKNTGIAKKIVPALLFKIFKELYSLKSKKLDEI